MPGPGLQPSRSDFRWVRGILENQHSRSGRPPARNEQLSTMMGSRQFACDRAKLIGQTVPEPEFQGVPGSQAREAAL